MGSQRPAPVRGDGQSDSCSLGFASHSLSAAFIASATTTFAEQKVLPGRY